MCACMGNGAPSGDCLIGESDARCRVRWAVLCVKSTECLFAFTVRGPLERERENVCVLASKLVGPQ